MASLLPRGRYPTRRDAARTVGSRLGVLRSSLREGTTTQPTLEHLEATALNIAHALDRGPGSEQQLLHRDELVWVHLPEPHPEVQVASIIALEDFTAENGATRLVPGSHRWAKERKPEKGGLPRPRQGQVSDAPWPAAHAMRRLPVGLGRRLQAALENRPRSRQLGDRL